jgi:hypothetical protein
MIADKDRLKLIYEYTASAYSYVERHCHDEIEPAHARQRDITRWSFEVVRGARPDVQPFTNLLLQFPNPDDAEAPDQLAPDNSVFVHPTSLKIGVSFDAPLHPVGPFLVMNYVSTEREQKYEDVSYTKCAQQLKVPYYLLFCPPRNEYRLSKLKDGEYTLFKLKDGAYTMVLPNAQRRSAIPELDLEVALLDGWMRYWFRGELVPLPGDLLKERDAERAARLAAEKDVARLRKELAKVKGQEE